MGAGRSLSLREGEALSPRGAAPLVPVAEARRFGATADPLTLFPAPPAAAAVEAAPPPAAALPAAAKVLRFRMYSHAITTSWAGPTALRRSRGFAVRRASSISHTSSNAKPSRATDKGRIAVKSAWSDAPNDASTAAAGAGEAPTPPRGERPAAEAPEAAAGDRLTVAPRRAISARPVRKLKALALMIAIASSHCL